MAEEDYDKVVIESVRGLTGLQIKVCGKNNK